MGPRHIVITGGASGLGFGCASRFIDRGDRVTIGDVNHGAAEEAVRRLQARAPQAMARCEPLDLADPSSVDAFASTLKARGEPVDVLVNNAGIYPPSRRTLSREGHELTFAIAYLGHFRLTHALWPLLKAAPAPRVVTVSSLTQRSAQLHLDDLALASNYQPIRAYAQAKLSCLLFAYELHRRQAGSSSPVASVAAHPGVVRTQIARNRRVSPDDRWWHRLSTAALRFGMGRFGQTPEDGALALVHAATDAHVAPGSFVGPTGWLEMKGRIGVSSPGRAASDPALAVALWERSQELTGIRWAP